MSPKGKRGKPPEDKPNATSEVQLDREGIIWVIQFRPSVDASNGVEKESQPLPTVDVAHMDPSEAVRVLAEVAALNDRAILAHQAFAKSQAETKQLRAKWEELAEQVQSRLKELTHPTELPLFDERKAEADLSSLQAAAEGSAAPEPTIAVEMDDVAF